MQWLARLCIRRPVFAAVLILSIVVIGLAGYFQLGLDQFPNIDVPMITVTTKLSGAAPEEVETEITEKIEEAVNTISGLDELQSTSSEGVSVVELSFVLEKSADVAAQEVRDKINRVLSDLPEGIDSPVVQKIDPDASPILYIAVRSTRSTRETTEIADKIIRRKLEGIAGVGQVNLVGGRLRQINVWLDPEALRARGLTARDVQTAVANQNLSSPGGTVDTGPVAVTLRIRGRVESPAELGAIVLRKEGAHTVRLSDVARVEDGEAEEETLASVNGARAILLSIRRQSGVNTVAVVDAVRARLAEVERSLPAGCRLEVVRDNSGVVRTSVATVREHLILGAICASLVVLLFLGNFRSSLIAALAIPVSIIGTFALMWWQGFTLNMITLLALALAVGIVIDDAVVVLENIHRFIAQKGMKPFPAAVAATKDIGLAVLATTFSLMAVFLPVAFMSGISGRFMRGFGLTMAFSIAVSMLVAFSLTPSLSARWLAPPATGSAGRVRSRLERWVDRGYRPIENAYMAILRAAMRRRWIVVAASALAIVSTAPLLALVSKGFLPDNDEGNFEVNLRAPEGTSIAATSLIAERIAREIRAMPEATLTSTTIGDNDEKSTNVAKVYVQLTDPTVRKENQKAIMARVRRDVVAGLPKDLRIDISEASGTGPGSGVKYYIMGPDLAQLGACARQIVERLRQVPAAVDATSNYIQGKPEIEAVMDREKAADLGVQVADVANTLRLLVGGLKVSTYAEGGEEYDIRLRADRRYRSDAEGLALVTVPSSLRGSTPLADVVSLRQASGPADIERYRRQRLVSVTANVAPGYGQSDVEAAFERIVADLNLPSSYHVEAAGMTRETGRTFSGFLTAFFLAVVFMYLVLAAQFESWLHPVTILLALPLTIPFALLSLLLFHESLNIFTALGLFVLFGIVKKNSILQVDHANTLRREGVPRLEAVLQANRDRLRPILMTTIAFVAGMIPLAFAKGIGAGQSRSIASVVMGGQTFSLLLTLLATPVAYSLFDDLGAWLRRRFGRSREMDRGETEMLPDAK